MSLFEIQERQCQSFVGDFPLHQQSSWLMFLSSFLHSGSMLQKAFAKEHCIFQGTTSPLSNVWS
jgi:hypothetical protein